MIPFAWWGDRLLCEGRDGREYLKKKTTWFDRWWWKNLPYEEPNT